MNSNKIIAAEAFKKFGPVNQTCVDKEFQSELQGLNRKIIVLDDDPTGVQTVHDIHVYTDWSVDSIEEGFKEDNSMFFILTNSRGFTSLETEKVHGEIARNILKVSKKLKREFIIISRSDSTLRGHYPLETNVLRETIEANSGIRFNGEVILPFFKEGGRFTIDSIHYVQEGEYLIPAGETEFAADKTFGYTQSHLGKWIEEKCHGEFRAENFEYISHESIRNTDIDGIVKKLSGVDGFNKVVVDAVDYVDVEIFSIALIKAIKSGRNFMFRTAAAFTKVIGGIADRGLLLKKDLIKNGNGRHGGLIIAGSHVRKTTDQLEELRNSSFVEFVEFNQHLVLEPDRIAAEVDRVVNICEGFIKAGKTVAVYTKRERLDIEDKNKEEELRISIKISDAVTSIVQKLSVRPDYIIAKGGITSSDIGTKGLKVKKALVAGQIKPGVPVWITGSESKFPGMPYIIFPGNVGARTTLREAAEILACDIE